MLNRKNVVVIAIVVLVIVGVGFWFQKVNKDNGYSVVYLTTGEVYVGKLTTFPDFQLKNGYILQVTKDEKDPTKANFQLQPVDQALWAPEVLHINQKNVVFYGPILSTSKIAQTLAGKGK